MRSRCSLPARMRSTEVLPQSPSQWIQTHQVFISILKNIMVSYVSTGRFWHFHYVTNKESEPGMLAHTCNPSIQQAQSEGCEFEVRLPNIVCSRPAQATG